MGFGTQHAAQMFAFLEAQVSILKELTSFSLAKFMTIDQVLANYLNRARVDLLTTRKLCCKLFIKVPKAEL